VNDLSNEELCKDFDKTCAWGFDRYHKQNLWFDVASNAFTANPAETSDLMVKLIRQIGVKRILYGTDGAAGNNLPPRESWEAFRQLKLSKKEIKTIARNVAPYLR
jgi:predicted TIM-barrel fold metal-dependent hydrolase